MYSGIEARIDARQRTDSRWRFVPVGIALLFLLTSFQRRRQTTPDWATFESPPDAPHAEPSAPRACEGESVVPNVYLHSGEFFLSSVDLRIPGRGMDFFWARKYRSRLGPNTAQGNGWDSSYNIRIVQEESGVRLFDGNTRRDLYLPRPGGTYAVREFFREGRFHPDGTFTLTFADAGTWNFRALDGTPAAGKIASIVDRNGNALQFQYDGLGRLVQVIDTLNRAISIAHDANGFIQSVTDHGGRRVSYAYYGAAEPGGSSGDLKSVTTPAVAGFPLGKTTTFSYSKGFADERLNHNLLTIRDPQGQTWLANTYASALDPRRLMFDRIVRQRRGNPGDDIKIETELVPLSLTSVEPIRVIVNDRVGNVTECHFDRRGRMTRKLELTGRADPALPTTSSANRPMNPLRADDPPSFETVYGHNADSLVRRIVHPDGAVTERVYELALDPGAAWRARGNLRELRRTPGTHTPAGDQDELVELYEYQAGMGGCCGVSFETRHVDARGNETLHAYDSSGNRIRTQHAIPAIVDEWEYNANGQMTAHVLPDNGSGWRRRDEFVYHGSGSQNGYLQSEIVDANGLALTTTHEYDTWGNVVRTIDARGNDTLYLVNALAQVVREQSRRAGGYDGIPLHRYQRDYQYNANDNVVRVDVGNVDDAGVVQANAQLTTTYAYDVLNRRTSTTREVTPTRNIVVSYEYDGNGNLTLTRYGQATSGAQPANVLRELHDERGLLWRSVRAEGDAAQSTTQYDYDGHRNLKALRQGLEGAPRVTTYVYDAYDRRVQVIDPMGNETLYHYDANGNVGGDRAPGVPNPFGEQVLGELVDAPQGLSNVRLRETNYVYDALDRRVLATQLHFHGGTQAPIGDGASTTMTTWSPASLELSVTDDNGHVTTFEYDTANRLSVVTDGEGNTATSSYDANSNVVELFELELSELGNPPQTLTTSYAYDALDRLVVTTDGLGQTERLRYDSRGNRVLETDKRGNRTRYAYDGVDRLIGVTRSMTDTGTGSGTVNEQIVTAQAWDDSGRLISQTDDNGNTTTYQYDALDRLVTVDYADCTSRSFVHDVHDDPIAWLDANGTSLSDAYDGLGRLTGRTVVRAPGVIGTTSESYQYDGLSRIVSALDDDSLVMRTHDSLGSILVETQRVLPFGPRTIASVYDGEGNRTQAAYPGGRVITYAYDGLDRVSTISDSTGSILTDYHLGKQRVEQRDLGNGTSSTYAYDALARTVRTTHTGVGGAILDDRTYQWDEEGNKTERQDLAPQPDVRTYAYDSLDRLVQSTSAANPCTATYSFDGVGNRTNVSSCTGDEAYSMSATLCEAGDAQMSQYSAVGVDVRSYDANGNLVGGGAPARTFSYDYRNQLCTFVNVPQGETTTYRYDCFGRRIERKVGTAAARRHYYLGAHEIEEQAPSTTFATYVWREPGDTLVQVLRSGVRYYVHADDQGSVVRISDASGDPREALSYRDYGEPLTNAVDQQPDHEYVYDSHRSYSQGSGNQVEYCAEDFAFGQQTTITALRWWGGYDYAPPPVPSSDSFMIEIYDSSGPEGLPGALLCQEYGWNVSRVETGQTVGGAIGQVAEYVYDYSLQSPFVADAGRTYWLVVTNDTYPHPHTWGWETSSKANTRCAFSVDFQPWHDYEQSDFALKLTTTSQTVGVPYLFAGARYDPETSLLLAECMAVDVTNGSTLARMPGSLLETHSQLIGSHGGFGAAPTLLASIGPTSEWPHGWTWPSTGGATPTGKMPIPIIPPPTVWTTPLAGPPVLWFGGALIVGVGLGTGAGLLIEKLTEPAPPERRTPAGCTVDDGKTKHQVSDWYLNNGGIKIEHVADQWCKDNAKCSGKCPDKEDCKAYASITDYDHSWYTWTATFQCACGCK